MRKLRVWWISNPPRKPFHFYVDTIEEAKIVSTALAKYDLYLGDMVSCNAQGLETFEEGEWSEYYDEEGNDLWEDDNFYTELGSKHG